MSPDFTCIDTCRIDLVVFSPRKFKQWLDWLVIPAELWVSYLPYIIISYIVFVCVIPCNEFCRVTRRSSMPWHQQPFS